MRNILVPNYVLNFKCIGSECEDTCCAGWNIDIDKDSYNKYKKIKQNDISKLLKSSIKINKNSKNSNSYARFILKDNKCPMLSEEGLCNIYIKLGEKSMCNTCQVYPRIYNYSENGYEKSLQLSCPEAAKLILLNPDGIEYTYIQTKKPKIINNIIEDRTNDDYWQLRLFSIDVLQNRFYSVEERLFIIGLVIDALSKDSDLDVKKTISKYLLNVDNGSYKDIINKISKDKDLKYQKIQLAKIYRMISKANSLNSKYKENQMNICDALGLSTENLNDENVFKKINDGNLRLNEFRNEYDYILENYLVNYVFKSLFPYNKNKDIFKEYMNLIINYLILKISLIGTFEFYKDKIGIKDVLYTIQNNSILLDHNTVLRESILEAFNKTKENTLAHMVIYLSI